MEEQAQQNSSAEAREALDGMSSWLSQDKEDLCLSSMYPKVQHGSLEVTHSRPNESESASCKSEALDSSSSEAERDTNHQEEQKKEAGLNFTTQAKTVLFSQDPKVDEVLAAGDGSNGTTGSLLRRGKLLTKYRFQVDSDSSISSKGESQSPLSLSNESQSFASAPLNAG